MEAPPGVGARVTLHGMTSSAVLNGARGRVVSALDAATGRCGVRITAPPAAVAAHAAVAARPANLRPCSEEELAAEFGKTLAGHLQKALAAASELPEGGRASALRDVMAQAQEALAWLDDSSHALAGGNAARGPTALQFALLHCAAAGNLATTCEEAGDAPGALAALQQTAKAALLRPDFPAFAAHFGLPNLAHEMQLRLGEALRVMGRLEEAASPLRAAALGAAMARDAATEAQAVGTLSTVMLALGDLTAAEAASAREVTLLESASEAGGSGSEGGSGGSVAGDAMALSTTRARVGLAQAKCARAEASRAAADPAREEERSTLLREASLLLALAARAEAAATAATAAGEVPEELARAWAEQRAATASARGGVLDLQGDMHGAVEAQEESLAAAMEALRGAPPGPQATNSPAVVAHGNLDRLHTLLAHAGEEADGHERAVAARRAAFGLLGRPPPAECGVCMEALELFDAGGDVMVLRCFHAFHARCAKGWLAGNLQTGCPLCRAWAAPATPEEAAELRAARDAGGESS
jgi:hypothetical protein